MAMRYPKPYLCKDFIFKSPASPRACTPSCAQCLASRENQARTNRRRRAAQDTQNCPQTHVRGQVCCECANCATANRPRPAACRILGCHELRRWPGRRRSSRRAAHRASTGILSPAACAPSSWCPARCTRCPDASPARRRTPLSEEV